MKALSGGDPRTGKVEMFFDDFPGKTERVGDAGDVVIAHAPRVLEPSGHCFPGNPDSFGKLRLSQWHLCDSFSEPVSKCVRHKSPKK